MTAEPVNMIPLSALSEWLRSNATDGVVQDAHAMYDAMQEHVVEVTLVDDDDDGDVAEVPAIERRIRPGSRVRLVNCRPLYLVGSTGTVIERVKGGSKWRIALDPDTDPRALARFGDGGRAPESILEVID
jgi:hypothetical protein